MAVDKNKLIASAQRLTQKGQLDRAIREYRLIVDEDPSDVRIWMKIGDLYVRKGAVPHAIATYNKVAVTYREGGHHQKAAAIYKQIIGLAPGAIEAHLALGELLAKLNQLQEAISELQTVVGAYEREGRHRESCELLQRMVELVPEDEPNRIRLAEALARQGNLGRAAEEFRQVLSLLSDRGRLDDFIQVAERLLYLAPDQHETARLLAEVYLQRGQPKRALARLQTLFQANPTDPHVLGMLGQAFKDLGYAAKAASVYRELARIHAAAGDATARLDALTRLLHVEPTDAEAMAAVGVSRPSGAPGHLAAGSQPPRAEAPPPPATERVAGLVRDADLYVKYELYDHALARLEKVFQAEPDHIPGLERRANLLRIQKRERDALLVYLRLADLSRGEQAMGYLGQVLQIDPDHLDAKARLRGLSGGMAAAQEEPMVLPLPSDESFEVELDLDGMEFDDGLEARFNLVPEEAAHDGLDFELDLDALEPPPDDDAFGDLLNDVDQAPASREAFRAPQPATSTQPLENALQLGRQAFGDLLSSQDDFGDLLPAAGGGSHGNETDFGDLLAGDDALARALVPDAPVVPLRPSHAPPAIEDDDDEFGDLLSNGSLQDDDFGELLAPTPRPPLEPVGFSSVHASEVMELDDASFGGLLAETREGPGLGEALLELEGLTFGGDGEDTGLEEPEGSEPLSSSHLVSISPDGPSKVHDLSDIDLDGLLGELSDENFEAEVGVGALPGVMDNDGDGLEALGEEDLGDEDLDFEELPPTRRADPIPPEVQPGFLLPAPRPPVPPPPGRPAPPPPRQEAPRGRSEPSVPPEPSPGRPGPPRLPDLELPSRPRSLRDQLAHLRRRSNAPLPAPPPPPGGSLFDLRTDTPAPMPAEPMLDDDDEGMGELADLSGAEFFNIGGSVEWPSLPSELAELDFLLNRRLVGEARELLSELSQQNPGHPDLSERLDRILEIEAGEELVREAEAHADAMLDALDSDEVDFGTIQGSMVSDLAEDDATTHFDLGLAFREMGQYQKAIGQLEKARLGRDLFTEATRVLALVHVERGQPQQAVDLLVEALVDSRVRERGRSALRYELAGAFEAVGRRDRAADELRAVAAASNPEDFPDLPERLARVLNR